jgi:hypothetical protein
MQLVQNHCSHKSEQGEVCALQGSVIGVTLPEGWGQTQEEKFAECPFSVSSAPVSDGGKAWLLLFSELPCVQSQVLED